MSVLNTLRQKNPTLRDSSDDQIKSLIRKSPEFSTFSDAQFERFVTGNYGAQGESAPEEKGTPGFTGGLSAGVDQVQAMGGGLLQAAGDAFESDTLWDAGKDIYQRNMEEAGENSLGYGFTDITGPVEAFNWARYTAGNLAPTLAVSIAGGGVGGVAGRLLAGQVAKQTAIKAGQGLGTYASSAGMETGSIMGETEVLDVSLAHGALAGAMESLTPFLVLRKMGAGDVADRAAGEISDSVLGELKRTAGRSGRRAAGKGSLTGLVVESNTEGLQGLINQHASYWVDNNGESLLKNLGEVNYKQIIDEMAAGGLMGGGLGPVAGITERNRAQTQVERIEAARSQSEAEGGDALDQLRAAQEAERQGPLFEDGPFDPSEAQPDAPLFDDGPFDGALPPGLRESDRGQPMVDDFPDLPPPPAEGVPVIQRGPARSQPVDVPGIAAPPAEGVPVLDRGPRGASPTQDSTTGLAADDLSPFQRNQLRDYGVTDAQLMDMPTNEALAQLDTANRQRQEPKAEPTEQGTGVYRVPVDQIEVDPEQYQFRTNVNKKGVDTRLNSVKKWDDNRAGEILLHRRKDGSLFVADGHHRLDLAKRLGQPAVNARIMEESEGMDVPQARVEAAMANIADGKAEALDVAKVFRNIDKPNSQIREDQNLPSNQVAMDGEALANLSDNAFGMVAAGQLNEKDGAAIGASFEDPAQQDSAAGIFQKTQPKSAFERQLLVNEINAAGFAESQGEQGGLFGDDPAEISLLQQRLSVLNSLRQDLTFDKNLFGSLNKNAGRSGKAGNKIATKANKEITDESAAALDMINRVSTTPGLNDMVNRAAKRLVDGEKKAPVVRDLKTELLAYEQTDDNSEAVGGGGARSAAVPGQQPTTGEGLDSGESEQVPQGNTTGANQDGQPPSPGEGAGPAPNGLESGFDLEAQTETELAEQAAAKAEADKAEAQAKRDADQKEKADAESDDFVLSGSDRTADTAMAAGQDDLLAQAVTDTDTKSVAQSESKPDQEAAGAPALPWPRPTKPKRRLSVTPIRKKRPTQTVRL